MSFYKKDNTATPVKILLVDDVKANLVSLEAMLVDNHRTFFWAVSGEEALGLAYRHDFALILIDVQMPEMNGFELANILKSNNRTKNVPIIFVTAYRFEEGDVLQGYTEGAVDYLFKPLNVHITKSKVDAFIDLFRQRKYIEEMNVLLDEKNQQLQASNLALEDFANIVSHDLKEPLRTISSFMQLLYKQNKEKLDHKSLEFMEFCSASATKLDVLISSLRAYASVGYRDVDKQLVDLNKIVAHTQKQLTFRIAEKDAAIKVLNPLPKVLVNQVQFEQLFQNLIDNALKYQADENKPLIEIYSVKREAHWIISVKDNGIGINEAFRKRIFGLFQKYHESDQYEGTGVGLAICKRIVENSGGEIWIQSKEDKGTTFEFSVPVVENLEE